MSGPDLFAEAPTPITDAEVYVATDGDVGIQVVNPIVARGIERRYLALMDLTDRVARALERGSFESEDNFSTRRQVMHEEYRKFKEEG